MLATMKLAATMGRRITIFNVIPLQKLKNKNYSNCSELYEEPIFKSDLMQIIFTLSTALDVTVTIKQITTIGVLI